MYQVRYPVKIPANNKIIIKTEEDFNIETFFKNSFVLLYFVFRFLRMAVYFASMLSLLFLLPISLSLDYNKMVAESNYLFYINININNTCYILLSTMQHGSTKDDARRAKDNVYPMANT